jgi:hypothetical protein
VACLERIICEKRYRYFLEAWSSIDLAEAPVQGQSYQQRIYAEKRRIEELDQQRCVSFEDIAKLPWVGEYYNALENSTADDDELYFGDYSDGYADRTLTRDSPGDAGDDPPSGGDPSVQDQAAIYPAPIDTEPLRT